MSLHFILRISFATFYLSKTPTQLTKCVVNFSKRNKEGERSLEKGRTEVAGSHEENS